MSKMAATAVETADDALAVAEAALRELEAAYAERPKDPELSRQVGRLSQRVLSLRRAGEKRPAMAYFTDGRRRLDAREFAAALPPHCPSCQGFGQGYVDEWREPLPLRGYETRIGDWGVRCGLCKHEFMLEV